MKEPHDIRRILQESAAAPDVTQYFRDHMGDRETLLVVLFRAREPEPGARRREPAEGRRMFSEDQQPIGPLLPPPGTCTFTAATPPIHAPDGHPLAQLANIPDSLSEFVGAAFGPFSQPRRIPSDLPPPEERIAFRMIGFVQYRGEEGEVVIQTSRPSPAALSKELVILGRPVGTLPDGIPLKLGWDRSLRWRRDDLIIDLHDMSSRISTERLQELAADVVLI